MGLCVFWVARFGSLRARSSDWSSNGRFLAVWDRCENRPAVRGLVKTLKANRWLPSLVGRDLRRSSRTARAARWTRQRRRRDAAGPSLRVRMSGTCLSRFYLDSSGDYAQTACPRARGRPVLLVTLEEPGAFAIASSRRSLVSCGSAGLRWRSQGVRGEKLVCCRKGRGQRAEKRFCTPGIAVFIRLLDALAGQGAAQRGGSEGPGPAVEEQEVCE